MKHLFFTLCFTSLAFSQVIIEGIQTSSPSVSLEFGTNKQGLALPWISAPKNGNMTAGTIFLNIDTKKVQVVQNNKQLKDLTPSGTKIINDYIQYNCPEENRKTIIGGSTSKANGVLILEENNKAMVLPQADDPTNDIKNPTPGLIVYNKQKKLVCIFNGSTWSFWKQKQ